MNNLETTVEEQKAAFNMRDDLRDTLQRQSPLRSIPSGVEDTLEYLEGDHNVKKGLRDGDDRKELLDCIREARAHYGLGKKKGKLEKLAQGANKVGYAAQIGADATWFAFPLWGAVYKLSTGLFRMATDMLYAPYYLWNTGAEGVKELPEYAAQKVLGTILPGGTLIDKMSLQDRVQWMAVKRARVNFLKRQGLYEPLHKKIAGVLDKGWEYVKDFFGKKEPDYLPAGAPA